MNTSTSTSPSANAGPAFEEPDFDTATEQLVHDHLALARRIARRYAGRGIDTDDLCQVAAVGLIKAAQRFDPTRGDPFASYAIPTITGELRRHFRDQGWWVRPPRAIQELRPALSAAEGELHHRLGRAPTDTELADAVGAAVATVREARSLATCFRPNSIDTPVGMDGESPAMTIGEDDHQFAHLEAAWTVNALMGDLSESERDILRMRFADELTQADIARNLGVSQMQVSRVINKILDHMRSRLSDVSEPAAVRAMTASTAPDKAHLYAQARKQNIKGRSTMTKAQLHKAVARS